MRATAPDVVLLASRIRTEEKRLVAAFERRGVGYEVVDTRELAVPLDGATPPRTVLNREIGHYRASYSAAALEALGARVFNSAATTAVCGDKWRSSTAFARCGLPTPRTALAMTPQAALSALEEIGYPAVIKPLVGSWGRLVTAIDSRETAVAVLEHIAAFPAPQSHIVYVQQLIPKPDRDIRVVVVGGEALGATYRRGAEWRTNVARGALSEFCPLGAEQQKLAVAAAGAVGADIAGVDLLEDAEGRMFVLEVNHRVEFTGFQQAQKGRVDVADRIVEHVVSTVAA